MAIILRCLSSVVSFVRGRLGRRNLRTRAHRRGGPRYRLRLRAPRDEQRETGESERGDVFHVTCWCGRGADRCRLERPRGRRGLTKERARANGHECAGRVRRGWPALQPRRSGRRWRSRGAHGCRVGVSLLVSNLYSY